MLWISCNYLLAICNRQYRQPVKRNGEFVRAPVIIMAIYRHGSGGDTQCCLVNSSKNDVSLLSITLSIWQTYFFLDEDVVGHLFVYYLFTFLSTRAEIRAAMILISLTPTRCTSHSPPRKFLFSCSRPSSVPPSNGCSQRHSTIECPRI